jgi:hypothetical protein
LGKPEGKTLLGRSRCRREDNIKNTIRKEGLDADGRIILKTPLGRSRCSRADNIKRKEK